MDNIVTVSAVPEQGPRCCASPPPLTATVQSLPIASFSRSTGGRFRDNVIGFTTRETVSSEREHFVVVSSPEVMDRGLQQTVWLHQISADGQSPRLASKSLPDGVREDFGASLAVQIGNCDAACPRDEVWLAIGTPAAKVDKKTAGKVYFWNPWQGDNIADRDLSSLEGFFPRSGYGGALTALRGHEAGGGFVIGIPGAEVLDGTGSNGPKGGYVEVRLNKGGAETWAPGSRCYIRKSLATAGQTIGDGHSPWVSLQKALVTTNWGGKRV